MLLEMAVDPECFMHSEIMELISRVKDKERILLSSVVKPDKWLSRIKRSADGKGHAQRACKFATTLVETKSIISRHGLTDDAAGGPWATVAMREHDRLAFSAVVSGRELPCEIRPGFYSLLQALDSDAESFRASSSIRMRQTTEGFVQVVSPLLRHSTRALFVDPYLSGTDGKSLALKAIASSVRNAEFMRSFCDPLEVFLFAKAETRRELENQAGNIAAKLKGQLVGLRSVFYVVPLLSRALKSGGRVHNRYVVTNRFAVQFGDSWLPSGRDNPESTDDVTLLDSAVHDARWKDYWGCVEEAREHGKDWVVEIKS